MENLVSFRVAVSLLLFTCLGWEVSSQYFYTKLGKYHKEGSTYLKREAISSLQCAYFCTRDETCNSTSFNNDDGSCFMSTNILIAPANEDKPSLNSSWTGIYRGCKVNWTDIGDTCYYISQETKKFHEAKEFCQEEGGKLAEPQTNETFEILRTYMQEHYGTNFFWNMYWIGMKDVDKSDTMVWLSNGAVPQYSGWAAGEPDHYIQPPIGKDCVTLNDEYGFKWASRHCSFTHTFICEV